MDSMFIGVSGLESYQNQIDVVSNNIANVGTTGYKAQNVNFQDLFYQAQSYATAPTQNNGGVNGQQIGMGVKIGSIDTNWTEGGMQTTGVNTNLMLNGNGFFILQQPGGGTQPVYTRNGDFSLNQNGLLYNPSNGMAVQGYMATKGVVNQSGTPGNITIPLGLAAQAVGTGLNAQEKFGPAGDQVFDVSMGNNLNQSAWIAAAQNVQSGTPNSAGTYSTQTTIYDSLGVGHLATITYTPDATGATAGTATVGAPVGTGTPIASATGTGSTYTGALTATITSTNLVTIKDTNGNTVTGAPGSSVSIDGVSLTLGTGFTAAQVGSTQTVTTTAATNGLPTSVTNTTGQATTPASRWAVSVSFDDGTQFSTIATPGNGTTPAAPTYGSASSGVVGYAYFNQNGQYINTSSYETGTPVAGGGTTIGAADVHTAGQATSTLAGNTLNILAWGTGNTNKSTAPTAAGAAPPTGPIGLDFSNMTSLAASSTAASASTATVLQQNGFAAGTLDNITIGADGTITGAFTNGETQTLGRVAVATFANEDGLTLIGGSNYSQSANSGLAQIGTAGTANLGTIVAGSLEQSNVSIADQFAKMITAQNAYQANSKSITVASEDEQTVTQLIH